MIKSHQGMLQRYKKEGLKMASNYCQDSFHPIIVLKVGLALRAFHLADLWFQNTRTEGALNVSFWLGS